MVPSFPDMKRRISIGKAAAALVILALVGYVGAMVWLVTQETRILFQASAPMGERRPAAPLEIAGHAWLMRATSHPELRPWVLFLHGNASTIASRMNILHYERLRDLGLNVMAREYRGFGGVEGVPTESGLAEDAKDGYEYLRQQMRVDPRRIIVYGWSLGSAVAVNLSSRVDEAAVILEGAPASIVAIGQQRYPYFPIRLLIRNPFESISRIDKIGSPVLFLHSPEDAVIPIAEGRRLFDAAPQPKQFVEVSGGHVYASEKDPHFFPAIRHFLQSQHLLP